MTETPRVRKLGPDDVMTMAETADWLGIPMPTLNTWRRRNAPTADPFPPPWKTTRGAPLYSRPDVLKWARRNIERLSEDAHAYSVVIRQMNEARRARWSR